MLPMSTPNQTNITRIRTAMTYLDCFLCAYLGVFGGRVVITAAGFSLTMMTISTGNSSGSYKLYVYLCSVKVRFWRTAVTFTRSSCWLIILFYFLTPTRVTIWIVWKRHLWVLFVAMGCVLMIFWTCVQDLAPIDLTTYQIYTQPVLMSGDVGMLSNNIIENHKTNLQFV